jgi:PIN domain nuclease of toxin-antitoxin system
LDYISKLPSIHNDPFDRLIISQAVTEGLSLVTKDEKIAKYEDINVIW